jgi:uncharacterized Zn ribbon protein
LNQLIEQRKNQEQHRLNLPSATICSQCGEEWIDDATAKKLEQIVNDARARRLQAEVAAM